MHRVLPRVCCASAETYWSPSRLLDPALGEGRQGHRRFEDSIEISLPLSVPKAIVPARLDRAAGLRDVEPAVAQDTHGTSRAGQSALRVCDRYRPLEPKRRTSISSQKARYLRDRSLVSGVVGSRGESVICLSAIVVRLP